MFFYTGCTWLHRSCYKTQNEHDRNHYHWSRLFCFDSANCFIGSSLEFSSGKVEILPQEFSSLALQSFTVHGNTIYTALTYFPLNFSMYIQVSIDSSSPRLSDTHLYPLFVRPVPPDDSISPAIVALMKYFDWKYLAIVTQEEDLFTLVSYNGMCMFCELHVFVSDVHILCIGHVHRHVFNCL